MTRQKLRDGCVRFYPLTYDAGQPLRFLEATMRSYGKRPPKMRTCKRCGDEVEVGTNKVGRVIFPGGICFPCWSKLGKKKKAQQ